MDRKTPAFSELPLFWKTLIVVGLVTLLVLLVILVSVGGFMLSKEPEDAPVNIDEYSDLINSFGAPDSASVEVPVPVPDSVPVPVPDSTEVEVPAEAPVPNSVSTHQTVIRDLRGNPLLDLLAVRAHQ